MKRIIVALLALTTLSANAVNITENGAKYRYTARAGVSMPFTFTVPAPFECAYIAVAGQAGSRGSDNVKVTLGSSVANGKAGGVTRLAAAGDGRYAAAVTASGNTPLIVQVMWLRKVPGMPPYCGGLR